MPGSITAGTQAKAGLNVIQVNAIKRGFFGSGRKIFAQSNPRNFIVSSGSITPGDLIELITNNLDTAITNLNNEYQKYVSIFNNIIQMHYDAFRTKNPTVEPTADKWAALISARDEMLQSAEEVNRIITAIHSHPAYGTLTPVHLGILTANIVRNTRLRRAIIQYEIQARTDYNTNNAPRAPPRP